MIIGFKRIIPQERPKFCRTRIGINYALTARKKSRWNLTTIEATRLLLNGIQYHGNAPEISGPSEESYIVISDIKGSITRKTPIRTSLANIREIINRAFGEGICIEASAFKFGRKEGQRIYAAIYGVDRFFEANTRDTFFGKPLESIDRYFFAGNSALAPYQDETGHYHAFIFDINSTNFDAFGQQKKIKRFLKMINSKSMIVCPIYIEGELTGAVYIPLRIKGKKLNPVREKLLARIEKECQRIAFTIEKNGITGEELNLNELLKRIRWIKRLLVRFIDRGTDVFSLYLDAVRHNFEKTKEREKSILEHLDNLTKISEINDAYTGGHNSRVGKYAVAIVDVLREIHGARCLPKTDSPYSEIIFVDNFFIELAGKYHDIGKLGVSTDILRKSGQLSDEEWQEIRRHPELGKEILETLIRGFVPDFPEEAVQLSTDSIYKHHERLDGNGYPAKANYLDIPVITRIITIADSFDAMTSQRNYQKNKKINEALADLIGWAGIKYDPFLLWCFIKALTKGIKVSFQSEDSNSWHDRTRILKDTPFGQACSKLLENYMRYFSALETIDQANMEDIIKTINEQMLQAAINNMEFPFVEAIKYFKGIGINYEPHLKNFNLEDILTEKEYNKLKELNLLN